MDKFTKTRDFGKIDHFNYKLTVAKHEKSAIPSDGQGF